MSKVLSAGGTIHAFASGKTMGDFGRSIGMRGQKILLGFHEGRIRKPTKKSKVKKKLFRV
jgi:hypothetical protein